MNFKSAERQSILKTMRQLALNYNSLTLVVPYAQEAGNYDPVSNAAVDIQNTQTGELGKTISSWKITTIKARKAGQTFTDLMLIAAGAGYSSGKVKFFFDKRWADTMKEVVENEEAYLYIDGGYTYRPIGGIDYVGIFNSDECFIEANTFTPRARATGY